MKDRLLRLCGVGAALIAILAIYGAGNLKIRRLARIAAEDSSPATFTISHPEPARRAPSTGPTVIQVRARVVHANAQRFGVNLGGQTFYDSLQTLKNLIGRNPGFEGEEWRSVMRCGTAGANFCQGGPNSSAWPEGFLDGGTYEVLSGEAAGETGMIVHSSASNEHAGSRIKLSPMVKTLSDADYIAVRKVVPGDAAAGWDPQTSGGATVTTEYQDLSPKTPGKQALRLKAHGPGQSVALKAYCDTTAGQSFVQMRGPYTVRFRAKLISGGGRTGVTVRRLQGGAEPIFSHDVQLDDRWRDYSLSFTANEPRSAVGPVMVAIQIAGSEVLIDDFSLAEATSNGTAFRGDVVAALERLRPSVLRYMDSGQNFGSSLDNMLGPDGARKRTGYNLFLTRSEEVPLGLNEFLVLCEKIDAEPWYTIQAGWSEQEAANLMEFLGGAVTTKYGAARAAMGHPLPWTKTFAMVHLEFGNETWNADFQGEAILDPNAYADRTTAIFRAIRGSKSYAPGRVDLVVNGQAANADLTRTILDRVQGTDTIDIAPYTFTTFDDDSSTENIFGPMFAEPELMDRSPNGSVRRQAAKAAGAGKPARLAVYETNINAVEGTVGQASLNATVPSVGAGIATVEHMLLMLRDDGITVQNIFQLGGSGYRFKNTAEVGGKRDKDERSPVWSMVVDMGGATNRVRPSFLAEQLANEAIRPAMLETSVSGTDPTWDQPLSDNDKVQLKGAHEIQSFAFSDSKTNSLVIFNLSRRSQLTVGLSGQCAPQGLVTVRTLTSENITDSNETEEKVKIVTREEHDVVPGKTTFTLPPFSMTELASRNQGCMPGRGQLR